MGTHTLAHFCGLFILAASDALPELPTAPTARRLVTPSESQMLISPSKEATKDDAAALTIWLVAGSGIAVVLLSVLLGYTCRHRLHAHLGVDHLSFDRLIFDELPGRELSWTGASFSGPSVDDAFAGPQNLVANPPSGGLEISLTCPGGHDFEVATGDPPEYRGPTSCARCKRSDLARNCRHFMHCPECKYDLCPDCLPLQAARGQHAHVQPLRLADDVVTAQRDATQAASTARAAALRAQANMAAQRPAQTKPAPLPQVTASTRTKTTHRPRVASSHIGDEPLGGGDPQPQLQAPLTQHSTPEVSISSSGSTREASIKPQLPPLPPVRSAVAPPPPVATSKWWPMRDRRSGAGRAHTKTSSTQAKQRRLPRHVHFERPSRQDGLDPGNDPGDEGRSSVKEEESDDRSWSTSTVLDLGACNSWGSVHHEGSGDLEEALRIVEATAGDAASLLAQVEHASPLGKQQILAEVDRLEASEEYQTALQYVGRAHHSDSVFGIDPLGGTLLS